MTTSPLNRVIQHFRDAELAHVSDGQLLGHFVDRNDVEAFEALVHRHGPMVLGVCRRILGNVHDAEDAFQVAFLVLVRKAASVRPRQMVANWLYGVAQQTAVRMKTANAKRRAKEAQKTATSERDATADHYWIDVQRLLDQELSKLPEKYRLPVILCDLEGKSIKEATRQVGCPQGTLAGRLARARAMLAKRLARRGLALSTTVLTASLSEQVASASVPNSLMISTVRAGTLLASGQAATTAVVSASVAALTEGMVKSMLLAKLKTMTAVLVLASVGCIGVGVATYPVWADLHVAAGQESKADQKNTPGLTAIPETEVVVRVGQLYRLQRSDKKPIKKISNGYSQLVDVKIDDDSADGSSVVLTPYHPSTIHIALTNSDGAKEYFRVVAIEAGAAKQEPPKKAPEKLAQVDVRSSLDGIIQFVGTEIKEGEKVPANDVITLQVAGEKRKYRRLKEGDVIEKGQLLARLDDRPAQADLAIKAATLGVSKANLEAAETRLKEAEARYRTGQQLFQKKAISAEEHQERAVVREKYQADVKTNQAAVTLAEAELQKFRVLVEGHEIRSHENGVITSIFKLPGEAVKAGEEVFRIKQERLYDGAKPMK